MAGSTAFVLAMTVLVLSVPTKLTTTSQLGDHAPPGNNDHEPPQSTENPVTVIGLLDRLQQLEVQFAELKRENQEVKRLLSQALIDKNTSVADNRESESTAADQTSIEHAKEAMSTLDTIAKPEEKLEVKTVPGRVISKDIENVIRMQVYAAGNTGVNEKNKAAYSNMINKQQADARYHDNSLKLTGEQQEVHELTQLSDYGDVFGAQVKLLSKLYEDLKTRIQVQDSKKCAFSAARSSPLLGEEYAQNITFDIQFVNKGKFFDRRSGVFTCQIPGIYYFTFNIRTFENKTVGITLVKSGNVAVVGMTTDPTERNIMQSQSVMIQLALGDQVWLQLGPHQDYAIYSNKYNYITFSGFLIYVNNV
ncbi:uncharacterized protein [Ptychodera flava]|uniref:uncharacterized protein n=1 Tax=Ptychodera flava TaxID=63121 RepID=UPI003969C368